MRINPRPFKMMQKDRTKIRSSKVTAESRAARPKQPKRISSLALAVLLIVGLTIYMLNMTSRRPADGSVVTRSSQVSTTSPGEVLNASGIGTGTGAAPPIGISEVRDTLTKDPGNQDAPQCPVALFDYCYQVDYQDSDEYSLWRGMSDVSCGNAAEAVLLSLRDQGWSLDEYGYMDLFGNAWGCIVSNRESGQVLVVTIMPNHKYEQPGEGNPMITSVMYFNAENVE